MSDYLITYSRLKRWQKLGLKSLWDALLHESKAGNIILPDKTFDFMVPIATRLAEMEGSESQRIWCRQETWKALNTGKLHGARYCLSEGCESESNLEMHHCDYSNPMEIVWLCRHHHRRLHAGDTINLIASKWKIVHLFQVGNVLTES